jgi:hypothetical protein
MDLQNIKIKILAKANNGFEFICPPAKAGGNSMNMNMDLTHSRKGFNPFQRENSMNRNVALAHSIEYEFGFNPFH